MQGVRVCVGQFWQLKGMRTKVLLGGFFFFFQMAEGGLFFLGAETVPLCLVSLSTPWLPYLGSQTTLAF